MSSKNVTVILATFNGAKYVKKQIDSILAQTVLPGELIICDDGSTDDTVLILNSYLTNTLVKLIINDTRLGVVENFKKAAKMAEAGNCIAFADQDDIWMPQKLDRLVSEMLTMDDAIIPALVYSDLALIDKTDAVISASFWTERKIKPEKINLDRLLFGNMVTGCTILINYPMAREFFKMDDSRFLHDEWLALIAYSFGKFKYLNEQLVLYRQHDNNVTFSENNRRAGFFDRIKEPIRHLTGKINFLSHQFDLARFFLLKYQDKLTSEQITTVERFIALANKNYIVRRIKRRFTYSK